MPIIEQVTTTESSSVPVGQTEEQAEQPGDTFTELSIGDSTTGFSFPTAIGTNGQTLIVPPSGNTLLWGAGGGGGSGDILNGGQPGAVDIGSTDNKLTLRGNTGVKVIGGLDIQFDTINIIDTGSFTLDDSHHMVDITSTPSANVSVILPEAETREGKLYIISKGYSSGILTIDTQPTDKIDGDDTFVLTGINNRIQLVSGGTNRWMFI